MARGLKFVHWERRAAKPRARKASDKKVFSSTLRFVPHGLAHLLPEKLGAWKKG